MIKCAFDLIAYFFARARNICAQLQLSMSAKLFSTKDRIHRFSDIFNYLTAILFLF
jgi:hypothetical protein